MIAIIDYGLGNIKAFANVYKNLGIEYKLVSSVDELNNAEKIILPGVGAFDHAMELLNNSGMRETLDEMVLNKRIPVLGICVGMQIIANSSAEGKLPGLGWINAEVKKFEENKIPYKTRLPHMGWNIVNTKSDNPLFFNLSKEPRFYFLHSYYFYCNNGNEIANTEYGIKFTSAVNKENIFGVQFHPEKSHHNGVSVLKNFGNL